MGALEGMLLNVCANDGRDGGEPEWDVLVRVDMAGVKGAWDARGN